MQAAYTQLWGVVRLPAVRSLAAILLLLRLGMLPAEAAAPLKLLERGVSKEALAGMVSGLVDSAAGLSTAHLQHNWCPLEICRAGWTGRTERCTPQAHMVSTDTVCAMAILLHTCRCCWSSHVSL